MSILDDSLSHLEIKAGNHSLSSKGRLPKGKNPFVFGAIALVVVLGVFVSVKVAQRSSENRNQASTDQGQVIISSSVNPSPLRPGQSGEVILSGNTQGVQVDGIQLTFVIDGTQTQGFQSAPTVSLVQDAGMGFLGPPQVTLTQSNVYNVVLTVASLPDPLTGILAPPFSSMTPVSFAKLTFTPNAPGTVQFQFVNTSQSKATTYGTGVDTLLTVQPMNFTVQAAETPTATGTRPTLDPSATLRPPQITDVPTDTPSLTPTQTPTNTPTRTPTFTPTRTPTPIPGTTSTATPTNTPVLTLAAPTSTTAPGGTCNPIAINYDGTDAVVTAPRQGQSIYFTCGPITGAVRYEFVLKEPGSSTYNKVLNPVANGSQQSERYVISTPGDFSGQCRMCTGATEDTCQPWPAN